MGLLVDGQWVDKWYKTSKDGAFERPETQFRDGGNIEATPNRYRLYVSNPCPWAHRTLMVRALKGIGDKIPIAVVHPDMLDKGWTFHDGEGVIKDPGGARFMYEIYQQAASDYTGRVTVPVLFDTEAKTIVNNESSELIRILNTAFNDMAAHPELDFYPEPLRDKIDAWNTRIYPAVNNGVYRCGFATSQQAYAQAFSEPFAELDHIDAHLESHRYLCGAHFTEADIRLFTTLVRFDLVYYGHFKCNARRISDYKTIAGYVREIYQWPGVAATCNFEHIKRHYYYSHETINPHRIVPVGPSHVDFTAAPQRTHLEGAGIWGAS